MKKNKQKLFKKILLKIVSCFCIFSILFSLFCITSFADDYTYQTGSLSDFFQFTSYDESSDNNIVFYDGEIDNIHEFFHIRNGSGEGVFYGNVSRGNYLYTIKGDFLNKFNFDASKYYTLSFPLSFSTRLINIQDNRCFFSLVDKNGNKFNLNKVNALWPDKLNGDNNYILTIFFEGTFSGSFLVEVLSYELIVAGNNYNSSSSYFIGGLLKNRYVTITETSKSDYESIYGDPNIDYTKPSSKPQDDLHRIEQDLIDENKMGDIADFFGPQGNGGSSIVNITNGLQAAGVLFSELFNNNGRRYTIFSMLINFSLTLGLICLLLNLAPKLFSSNSSSKNRSKNKDKSKGGNKK